MSNPRTWPALLACVGAACAVSGVLLALHGHSAPSATTTRLAASAAAPVEATDTGPNPESLSAPFKRAERAPGARITMAPIADDLDAKPAPPVAEAATDPVVAFDDLATRMRSSLAVFDGPTEDAIRAWHAGREVDDLARSYYDAHEALAWVESQKLDPARIRTRPELERRMRELEPAEASLRAEHQWLAGEIERRIVDGGPRVAGSLLSLNVDELSRRYPTKRDRFALHAALRYEAMTLAQDIADDQFEAQRRKIRAGQIVLSTSGFG